MMHAYGSVLQQAELQVKVRDNPAQKRIEAQMVQEAGENTQ